MQRIQAGQPAAAEPLLEAVLAADARQPDALHLLGLVAHQTGRQERALEFVSKALAVAEPSPLYWNTLGSIQQVLGQLAAAAASFRRAAELAPGFALAHKNLGLAVYMQGDYPAAAAAYRRAIECGSRDRATRLQLARALVHALEYVEAENALEPVLAVNPGDREARELRFECRYFTCDWREFDDFLKYCHDKIAGGAHGLAFEGVFPGGVPSLTRADQLALARGAALRSAQRAGPPPPRAFARTPKSKLRIAYLSSDFREHPVANMIAEVFELHDRARFELLGYSIGPDDTSPVRARLTGAFDRFTDLRGLSVRAGADRIAADAIDVLVDLNGYTQFSAPQLLALRPAPIQVNFLGYPGTMGAAFVDYIVADRFVIPPEHAADYTEAPAYLPHCYMPSDRRRTVAAAPSRSECGLPPEGFVFCCANNSWKITPTVFALWMDLLREVPNSVLWLRDNHPVATRNLRAEAARHGCADRLVFAGRVDYAQHLGRLGVADLFLDTLPYNAHATANDALWAGLPVLTCVGDTFASRVCGSIVAAAGLPELITGSREEYRALALRLARDPAVLRGLRERLAATRLTSPLFDSARFTRNLEALYVRMWERYLAGEPPATIDAAPTPA